MARATHLTISTADRIRLDGRGGEENEDGREDGENEVRQEVQVSVTYSLDSGDTDLVRLAEHKALEVKLAHEAVWNRIGAFSGRSNSGRSNSGNALSGISPGRCSGRRASDEADHEEDHEDRREEDRREADRYGGDGEDGSDDPDDDPDDEPQGAGPPPVDPPRGGPARGAWYMPGRSRSGDAAAAPEFSQQADADPITGPQRILIHSRAKKAGLTPYALDSLVFQQFKVWKLEKLTKEQGASLLDALERDLKEKGEEQKDGKEGVPHADRNGRTATA